MFQEAIAQYLKQNHYESIQLKSVLFDMDGVLFDSMPYHAEAWHKTMKAHGLNLSREEAYMHEGRTGAGTINIVCQRQLGRDATQEEIESIYLEKSIEFNKHPQAERMRVHGNYYKNQSGRYHPDRGYRFRTSLTAG